MAASAALPQSISAWQHQQMDWQRACRPSCMPMGTAMAQLQTALTLGWAAIWDQRLQVSPQGHSPGCTHKVWPRGACISVQTFMPPTVVGHGCPPGLRLIPDDR